MDGLATCPHCGHAVAPGWTVVCDRCRMPLAAGAEEPDEGVGEHAAGRADEPRPAGGAEATADRGVPGPRPRPPAAWVRPGTPGPRATAAQRRALVLARAIIAVGGVLLTLIVLALYGVGIAMGSIGREITILDWVPAVLLAAGIVAVLVLALGGNRVATTLVTVSAWLAVAGSLSMLTSALGNPYDTPWFSLAGVLVSGAVALAATYLMRRA